MRLKRGANAMNSGPDLKGEFIKCSSCLIISVEIFTLCKITLVVSYTHCYKQMKYELP